MIAGRIIIPYVLVYAVGLATFGWYSLLVFGPLRDIVAFAGIALCLALILFFRRRGLKFWLCIPALVLASWEYLVIMVMVILWSISGFAP
jgi:hypothetical protein